MWGYPLVVMHRIRAAHGTRRGGLVPRNRLSTAADRSVVAPNNDTLYSSGWFDLRAGDLTIDVAPMDRPDRYWSIMLLDAFTNVTYVCRRLHGTGGTRARATYDPTVRADPAAQGPLLPLGTPTVWALARVLVDGPDDLGRAIAAQAGLRVDQPDARGFEPDPPRARAGSGGGDPGPELFGELRDALAIDPPARWHPPPPEHARHLLDGWDDHEVQRVGAQAGAARLRGEGAGSDRTRNGWGTRVRGADFGDDVTYRAAFARSSLAGHLPAENRSYLHGLDGTRPAQLRFPPGEDPPVDGFWSLCVYGPDLFFVDNELGRYSIGDRTAGLRRDADGGLTITIGSDRPVDVANWLPAPNGRGVLALRAYEGREAVRTAEWFPPALLPMLGT